MRISANSVVNAALFRRRLLAWYRKEGRDQLPWRRTKDPYAILVSEFMLQQTQVATVVPYYHRWMQRFPDIAALAAASEHDVLHAWQGLGYYARARNLRTTAQTVMEKYGGRFPRSLGTIQELPGVGRYTANAIASFAFDQSVPMVEANIARLLARLFNLHIPIDTSQGREALWERANDILPHRDVRLHNSALMDLGALICGPRPKCVICPVRNFCQAEKPPKIPIKRARPSLKLRTEHHIFSVKDGMVLLEQSQDRWRGMWTLPKLSTTLPRRKPLHISKFPFTNHRITLTVFPRHTAGPSRKSLQCWFPIDGLGSIPLPSPHRRALEALISERSQDSRTRSLT